MQQGIQNLQKFHKCRFFFAVTLVKASKVTVDFLPNSLVMVSDSPQRECLTGLCSACTMERAVVCIPGCTDKGHQDKGTVQPEVTWTHAFSRE